MTSANRMQLTFVRETTPGVVPDTPRMRKVRITGESLAFAPVFVESDEISDDRMTPDPIKTLQQSQGGVNFETSFPDDNSFISEVFRSAFFNSWVNTPQFFNDGVADSVITDAGTTTDTFAVAAGGAAVAEGLLVRATGFTNTSNNQIFRAVAGSGTTIVGVGLNLTAEVAPPATAKLKVIGFQGAAGDITALVDGLGSTDLDFTTLGLRPTMWLKVGGTLDSSQFAFLVTAGAKARRAGWGRIVAISANKITMDNLPAGNKSGVGAWTTDAGAGKTIKVFFGDQIKNGVTRSTMALERGFLGQAVPGYILNLGMQINTLTQDITSQDKIKGVATFTGLDGSASTTTLDPSPDPVTKGQVMAANANVGRLGVNGSQLVGPNWAKSFSWQINNNLRVIDSADSDAPVDINEGECEVTGSMNTIFGSLTEVQAFYAGTPRPINARIAKNGQALIYQIPRATYRGGGNPAASGKNTDVMASFDWKSSRDADTSAQIIADRLEYFEE